MSVILTIHLKQVDIYILIMLFLFE